MVCKRLDLKLIKINRITPAFVPEFLDWIVGASFTWFCKLLDIPMRRRMLRTALKPQRVTSVHTCHAMVSNRRLFLSLYLVITHQLSQADLLLMKYITVIGMLCSY